MAKTKKASYKFPILEQIFNNLTSNGTKGIGKNHIFTKNDWFQACRDLGIDTSKRLSSSNVILDLTRKDRGIEKRVPRTIIDKGYDLRKRTSTDRKNSYVGEFVYVGIGNALKSWLVWQKPHKTVTVTNLIPAKILPFLAKDEGALFSVIDYCDVLSFALYDEANTVLRVQNPMKWQPNEIDGLYFSDFKKKEVLFPCEAKALSTQDDINLEQMLGGLKTIKAKIKSVEIIPLALQMTTNGLNIGILEESNDQLVLKKYIEVILNPLISSWQIKKKKKKS
jgi:hypothetical protein